MRSFRGGAGHHRISAGGDGGSRLQEMEGVTALLQAKERVLTILRVGDGVDFLGVMKKNYDRLRRAGFLFQLAGSAQTPKGVQTVIDTVNATREWVRNIENNPTGWEAHSSKPNF